MMFRDEEYDYVRPLSTYPTSLIKINCPTPASMAPIRQPDLIGSPSLSGWVILRLSCWVGRVERLVNVVADVYVFGGG